MGFLTMADNQLTYLRRHPRPGTSRDQGYQAANDGKSRLEGHDIRHRQMGERMSALHQG
jgi:hypothetical protein